MDNELNELFPGKHADVGIIVQGGLYNTLIRALQQFGLADAFGQTDIPLLVLSAFCVDKRAVLMMEEGQPEYIEQELATLLRRADIQTPLHGKDLLPQAGEYTTEVMAAGLAKFLQRYLPQHTPESTLQWLTGNRDRRAQAGATGRG